MKTYTKEELRKALFALPSLAGCPQEAVIAMFLSEKINKNFLKDFHDMWPYTYLRETFLSDAIANLLGISKVTLNVWAGDHKDAIAKIFNGRAGWTSEEWAVAFLNFAAKETAPR